MSNWIPIIAICVIVLFFSFIMLYATLYPHFQ